MPRNSLRQSTAAMLGKLRPSYAVYAGAAVSLLACLTAVVFPAQDWLCLFQAGGVAPSYDAAPLLIAAAISLLAALRERYTISRVLGIGIMIAANAQVTAMLAGFPFSWRRPLPELPLAPAQTTHTSFALVTFFLFGCGLSLLSRRMSNQVLAIAAALGAVVSAIGGLLVLGHRPPQISFLTSVCILTLGIGLCALCHTRVLFVFEDLSPSATLIFGIGLVLILGGADTATIVKSRAALLSADFETLYSQVRIIQKKINVTQTAERNVANFLLTRDDKFLGAYLLAAGTLHSGAPDPELTNVPRLEQGKLEALISYRMASLDAAVRFERLGRHETAIRQFGAGLGPALAGPIEVQCRSLIANLQSEAANWKSARQVLFDNLTEIVLWSYGAAVLLVATTVILARVAAWRYELSSMKLAVSEFRETDRQGLTSAMESPETQRHVLLIDDSEDLMLLIEDALERFGEGQYRFTWARCLKDGFRELTKGGVDLVLLDLGLPETSGPISFACVRGCAPELPIIVLTGEDSPDLEKLLVAAGVDNYLVKQHISGSLLVQNIDAALRSNRRPPQVNFRRILSSIQ